ncbi:MULTISPECIES: SH3 domain-containing protein [unclassified Nodularia (in: cyanobacteria)]|uniref:SH3 domain-containing protein n=1 Tax=unclassified Nodularia (in: cyanobacteria) TaxID=2656917 RepID=UPI00187F7396|nr:MULTISPECIES: SH3 domain-containing protein [unclassified Nodularia (in: cyanobacteria)]MBE9197741.1 SH3 domain-containing protein [Nodularia sp. LEGE 06071]MCC2692617.1 SH3 domain-containing protein [Nodularia sp. LEGE 04288]
MFFNVLKFILGFVLAIAILTGSGVAVALYFINRTFIPPAKPLFANDSPSLQAQAPEGTEVKTTSTPTPKPTPTPAPTPTPTPTDTLPPGAYRGLVTWPEGLSVRSQPSMDAERIAGVAINEELIVLEESQDKSWQKIRTQGEQEGWIKIGNIQRVEE